MHSLSRAIAVAAFYSLSHTAWAWTTRQPVSSSSSSSRTFASATSLHRAAAAGSHFGQHLHNNNNNDKEQQQQPSHQRRHDRTSIRADSVLAEQHAARLEAAGRPGTPAFRDPCRVWIGNLDLSVTSEELADWICTQHAVPAHALLVVTEVVRDWRTGKSKGFGFVRYQEPIQATVALTQFHGRVWKNRKIAIQPANVKGKHLRELEERKEAYEERERRRQERAVQPEEAPEPLVIEPQEAHMLRALDPDLLQGVVIRGQEGPVGTIKKQSRRLDDDIDPNLNRENRRKQSRTKPKRRPANRGFG